MCTHRAQNAALKNHVEQLMRDKEALKMQHLQSGTAACDFPSVQPINRSSLQW